MDVSIFTTGDGRADRLLATLIKAEQKKAVAQATRAAAKHVLADAKRGAPHDEGTLERSLTVRTAKVKGSRARRRSTKGHAVVTRGGMFAGQAYYGGFIEYGTKPRKTKAGQNRSSIEPNPFLRPALWDNERRTIALFRHYVKKAVQNLKRKG